MSDTNIQPPQQLIQMNVTQRQANWVTMSEIKDKTLTDLQQRALSINATLQQLNNPDIKEWKIIETGLMDARKQLDILKNIRLDFTNTINQKIIQPMMEPEKSVDPKTNQFYISAENRRLQLKLEEENKINQANWKNQEKAMFRAHLVNEFSRIVETYRQLLRREYNVLYESSLKNRVKYPAQEIENLKRTMVESVQPPMMNQFNRQYMSVEECKEIYDTIKSRQDPEIKFPDLNRVLPDVLKEMDELFSGYEAALANADAAIKANEDANKLRDTEEKQVSIQNAAMNNLVASAQAVQIATPNIKRTMVVKMIENENSVVAIQSAFIANRQNLFPYLRVKKLFKLTVEQQATAIGQYTTETGHELPGIIYNEVAK